MTQCCDNVRAEGLQVSKYHRQFTERLDGLTVIGDPLLDPGSEKDVIKQRGHDRLTHAETGARKRTIAIC